MSTPSKSVTVTGSDLEDIRRMVSAPEPGFLHISRRGYSDFASDIRDPGFIIRCDAEEVPLVFKTVEEAAAYVEGILRRVFEHRPGRVL